MLPWLIQFTDNRILHRPSITKPKILNQHNIDQSNIQQNSNPAKTQLILLRTKSKPLLEKTDVGTVKMVEDNCEAVVSL